MVGNNASRAVKACAPRGMRRKSAAVGVDAAPGQRTAARGQAYGCLYRPGLRQTNSSGAERRSMRDDLGIRGRLEGRFMRGGQG
jgi:hypothetical protein